jgi:hypothetical protein
VSVTLAEGPRSAGSTVSYRGTLRWSRLVCLAAFGPYVAGNARTEQIVVFASFAWVLVIGWPRILQARSFAPMPIMVLWLGVYAVMLIGSVSRPVDLDFYGAQPASHALSFLLLPLALMVVTWYWTLGAPAGLLIKAITQVTVAAMAANTVISFAQFITGEAAVVSFLPRFWDSGPSAGSVAALAAGNFRYSGIFNQPAEAGAAYGLALFCLIWLAQRKVMPAVPTSACAVMLIAGGMLTLSKIFLLGGIPFAVLTVLVTSRSRVKVIAAAAIALIAARLATGVLPSWHGAAVLPGLIHPGSSLAGTYSAGRYGNGGTLVPVVADVLRSSPWYGFGASGMDKAYDSLWVEALAVAGVVGAIMMVLVLVVLAYRWLHLRSTLGRPEWRLAGATLALAAGASLGLPSLTANRVCTLLWLIVGVLIAAQSPSVDDDSALADATFGPGVVPVQRGSPPSPAP